ncbi:MAG: acyl-CoA thioesterase [Coxiellaceae bacterium]|nr:acyl-CoA thioesterase [Coxiellaceae bacterium]
MEPKGQLAIRTLAMPCDTNMNGDVFGGWVISQMDLAGLSIARKCARGRVTTVAIDKMVFLAPVHVGDFICCYAALLKTGRTSMTVLIQTFSTDELTGERRHVTEGIFTYVSIDDKGKPKPLEQ